MRGLFVKTVRGMSDGGERGWVIPGGICEARPQARVGERGDVHVAQQPARHAPVQRALHRALDREVRRVLEPDDLAGVLAGDRETASEDPAGDLIEQVRRGKRQQPGPAARRQPKRAAAAILATMRAPAEAPGSVREDPPRSLLIRVASGDGSRVDGHTPGHNNSLRPSSSTSSCRILEGSDRRRSPRRAGLGLDRKPRPSCRRAPCRAGP